MADGTVPERTLIGHEPSEAEAKRIADALALLLPTERPTVPIRMVDPDPKQFYIFKRAPATEAIADHTDHVLYLNRQAPGVTGPLELLAGVLGHEQRHFEDGVAGGEDVAYQRQYDILKRLGYEKQDPKWMMQLYRRIQQRAAGRR